MHFGPISHNQFRALEVDNYNFSQKKLKYNFKLKTKACQSHFSQVFFTILVVKTTLEL